MRLASQTNRAFDFDSWATLAQTDPAVFEQRRLALIEDFLARFPHSEQRRLRGLQFRIDMERRRARTPMAACLKLSAMMWDSLLGHHGLKNALDALLAHSDHGRGKNPLRAAGKNAHILPFRKPAP
jgi:hypothetical protein